MNTPIWYVGGKSAGHIMPLVTLAQASAKPAVFITTHRALDKQIISNADLDAEHCALFIPDIQRKKFWLYPWHIALWLYAGIRLTKLFLSARPEKVVSTGGLSAVPVFLWAFVFRVPCELFELNATPGDAVRILAPLSTRIFYCYKTAAHYLPEKKLHYKPYPVRAFNGVSQYESRIQLELNPRKRTICFLGGSQGSHFINDFAQKLISQFSPNDIQVIHQAGGQSEIVRSWYAEHGYKACVVDYYNDIELLYSAADFVVCRAGAGTLWELEYMNTRTCIIPLETAATDHQVHNARALCAQKPEQFSMFTQAQAEKSIESIISFWGLESQLPADFQDHDDLAADDLLFHQQ